MVLASRAAADRALPDRAGLGRSGVRGCRSLRGEHPGELVARVDAELGVRMPQVVFDGLRAEEQGRRGLPGRAAGGEQERDLQPRAIRASATARSSWARPPTSSPAAAGHRGLSRGEAARSDGLEIRPYVHQLYRHLAACDLAIVQGGLTTAMELTASRRPFL
jgi:hypothetical protein